MSHQGPGDDFAPTTHEELLSGPLPAEFVERVRRTFDLTGYVVIENCISRDEIEKLNDEISKLQIAKQHNYLPLIDKGDALLNIAGNPKVLAHAVALMGGNIQLLSSNTTNVHPGDVPIVWHIDGPPGLFPDVIGLQPLMNLKFGFFFQDLHSPGMGNLLIVPGSHKRPFPHGKPREYFMQIPEVMCLRVKPGSVVLFHNAIWHSTDENHHDFVRRILYYTYVQTWQRIHDYLEPPASLVEKVHTMHEPQRSIMRQLIGVTPPNGAPGFYFPHTDKTHFPLMNLL